MADDAAARLSRLLGGEALAGLRQRLRLRYERAAAGEAVRVLQLGALQPHEHAALAALLGRPGRYAASMRVDLAAIDEALRRAGVAPSLRGALEALDGPIVHRAGERERLLSLWHTVVARCGHPALAAVLQVPAGAGMLKRLSGQDVAVAAALLQGAEAVLLHLPAAGITRAQLAARVLGDAHALDGGSPVASLVLAALRHAPEPAAGDAAVDDDESPGELGARDLWARAGVLVNELARPALFLNLPGAAAPRGEPAYLSLRSLLRNPPAWAVAGSDVYVCENPNLVAIAADALGPRCAPLVCTDGMPAAAQRTLLGQLRAAGARLNYHGDFDWPGLRIANQVMQAHGAVAWRFGRADYLAAVASRDVAGRPLQGDPAPAPWDEALTRAMQAHGIAIDEEAVAADLLADLARD